MNLLNLMLTYRVIIKNYRINNNYILLIVEFLKLNKSKYVFPITLRKIIQISMKNRPLVTCKVKKINNGETFINHDCSNVTKYQALNEIAPSVQLFMHGNLHISISQRTKFYDKLICYTIP